MTQNRPERRAVLEFTPAWLVRFFKQKGKQAFVITHNGLPADTQFLDAAYDAERGVLRLLLTSEEFDIVPEAVASPVLPPPFGYSIHSPMEPEP